MMLGMVAFIMAGTGARAMDSLPISQPKVASLDMAKNAQSDLLVLGIVGAVGAGTSWTARVLISFAPTG